MHKFYEWGPSSGETKVDTSSLIESIVLNIGHYSSICLTSNTKGQATACTLKTIFNIPGVNGQVRESRTRRKRKKSTTISDCLGSQLVLD